MPLRMQSYLENMCIELDACSAHDTEHYYHECDDALARLYVAASTMGQFRLEALLLGYKLVNLFVCKHDYLMRRIHLAGGPLGFMLDPANGCNLGCASCTYTSNQEFAKRIYNVVPPGVMKPVLFDRMIDSFGPAAFTGHFYNNAEPFVNKKTPSFVKRAAQFRVRTAISSNMAIPNLDVEAIVDSGLDDLQIAVDGLSQEVYERYRRGGDIQVVLDNVQRLVEEKRRQGSATPFIRWHFLTFEHNVHELDAAIEKATELGIDFFFIATPNDVSADTPDLVAVRHDRANQGIHLHPVVPAPMLMDISPALEVIESSFANNSFSSKYLSQDEELLDDMGYCDWLWQATVSDAHGRIFPCCIGDIRGHGTFQFGSFTENSDILNTEAYKAARRFVGGRSIPEDLRCKTCNGRPTPQVGVVAVRDFLTRISGVHQWLTPSMMATLTGWSKHKQ